MKRSSYLINIGRTKTGDCDAVGEAFEPGHLAGYSRDIWLLQQAAANHLWRMMRRHGMRQHDSGSRPLPKARYAAGTREILERHLERRLIRDLIVEVAD